MRRDSAVSAMSATAPKGVSGLKLALKLAIALFHIAYWAHSADEIRWCSAWERPKDAGGRKNCALCTFPCSFPSSRCCAPWVWNLEAKDLPYRAPGSPRVTERTRAKPGNEVERFQVVAGVVRVGKGHDSWPRSMLEVYFATSSLAQASSMFASEL